MYIDCSMGAAGDMLTGALLELLPEEGQRAFIEDFNALGLPGIELKAEPAVKCGITGTHVRILADGVEEGDHMHEHQHGHASHSHRGVAGIEHIVKDHLELPDNIKKDILAVFGIIAEAESRVHGVPVSDIHFHEVGTMDAIADVTAVCMLMDRIRADRVIASPVNTGSGTVKCAHGVLPVPAPATANILMGIPAYEGETKAELCTPTGAALLKHFADDFGRMPVMTTEAIGYGMGTKDFETANCVRIMLGSVYGQ